MEEIKREGAHKPWSEKRKKKKTPHIREEGKDVEEEVKVEH